MQLKIIQTCIYILFQNLGLNLTIFYNKSLARSTQMTDKQLYQLSLLCKIIESTTCSNLTPLMKIDPTSLVALKQIVAQTNGLSSQQGQHLNSKANKLLKVVRHVKQQFSYVWLHINQKTVIPPLNQRQKKIQELKQRKIKNICGQLLLQSRTNNQKNSSIQLSGSSNYISKPQPQRQLQRQQSSSIEKQQQSSKVSKSSQKRRKYQHVQKNQKNNNKAQITTKLNMEYSNQNQNNKRRTQPIRINLISHKGNVKNDSNQQNMMNFSNVVQRNQKQYKRQKQSDYNRQNLNLSQLIRPQYRKTQTFSQSQQLLSGHPHMKTIKLAQTNNSNSHNNNEHNDIKITHHNVNANANAQININAHKKKLNKTKQQSDLYLQRQREKSPLIKRILKTQYENDYDQQEDNYNYNYTYSYKQNLDKDYNKMRENQVICEDKKYNQYFVSTTTDQDGLRSRASQVKSKIRKIQRKDDQVKNKEIINNQRQKEYHHERPKSPKLQKQKNITNITKIHQNNVSQNNVSQNQTFKTDDLFDSHLTMNQKHLSDSSQSQILRLKAEFQRDSVSASETTNYQNGSIKIHNKAKNNGNANTNMNFNEKIVLQEEPWQCDELQLEQELKAIDERLSHRANKTTLHKGGIQTLSHLQLKQALDQAHQQYQQHHNFHEPKVVRLSLTPKGCKQLLTKKSKISMNMKQSTSKSNLKSKSPLCQRSKSPLIQKSKSQDKQKKGFSKNFHHNPALKVSRFDQDFAFPISIEVEVNKNSSNIGKWNNKMNEFNKGHPKRKQLLSDQIESIRKFY